MRVQTKHGERAVVNIKLDDGEKCGIWSEDINEPNFIKLKVRDNVTLIKTPKGAYQLVNNKDINSESTSTVPTHTTKDSGAKLPILSTQDKKELALYIKQQVELFYYINKEVSAKFTDLKSQDHRAISMSIFIDCQRKLN